MRAGMILSRAMIDAEISIDAPVWHRTQSPPMCVVFAFFKAIQMLILNTSWSSYLSYVVLTTFIGRHRMGHTGCHTIIFFPTRADNEGCCGTHTYRRYSFEPIAFLRCWEGREYAYHIEEVCVVSTLAYLNTYN